MATYNPSQLYGTGITINFMMNNTTTFRLNKTAANVGTQHVYLTFDVIGGDSTAVPLGKDAGWALVDTNGVKLHTAFSPTNWAYSFPGGSHDTGATTIATSLPTIAANTMRVRALGMTPSDTTTCLTITT